MAKTEQIPLNIKGPYMNRAVPENQIPPQTFGDLVGVDNSFNGCLRKFYGMKTVKDLAGVASGDSLATIGDANGISYFKAVTLHKRGTSVNLNGFVVRWDDGSGLSDQVVSFAYTADNGSTWAAKEIWASGSGNAITSALEIDCATEGDYLFVCVDTKTPKTIHWDSSLKVVDMGPGAFSATLAAMVASGSGVVDTDYNLLGSGTYQAAWRFYDSTRGIYSSLSDPVIFSLDNYKETKATGSVFLAGRLQDGDVLTVNGRTYGLGTASQPDTDLVAVQLAAYKLDETTGTTADNDEGTAAYDGTISSDASTLTTAGKLGTAFDFGGADGVTIPDNAVFSFDDSGDNPFSIELFVEVSQAGTQQTLFAKYDNAGGRERKEWRLYIAADDKLVMELYDESVDKFATAKMDDALSAAWHHIVVTYDSAGGAAAANGILIYIDGSVIAGGSMTYTTEGGYIGMEASDGDVTIGMEPTPPIPTASPMAYYLLEEDAANTTVDNDEGTAAYDGVASANTSTLNATGKVNDCFDMAGSKYVTIADHNDFSFQTDEILAPGLKFLCNFNGTDGVQASTDESDTGHTINFNGNAQLDTAQKKFGTASCLFDGAGDYLDVDDHADWDIMASNVGDYTIDFFLRHTNAPGADEFIIAQAEDINNYWALAYNSGASNLRFLARDAVGFVLNFSCTTNTGADTNWHHVAIIKVAADWAIYIDGNNEGMDSLGGGDVDTFAASLEIGREFDGTNYLDGAIDSLRISAYNIFGADPTNGADTITVPTAEPAAGVAASDDAFSIEAFVYVPASPAGIDVIISKDNTNQKEWNFYLDAGKLTIKLWDESVDEYTTMQTDAALSEGWRHVFMTYDGTGGAAAHGGLILYVDSVAVAQTGSTQGNYDTMENGTADIIIGASEVSSNIYPDKLDNIRVFNEEVSSADVTKYYNSGNGMIDNGTDNYYCEDTIDMVRIYNTDLAAADVPFLYNSGDGVADVATLYNDVTIVISGSSSILEDCSVMADGINGDSSKTVTALAGTTSVTLTADVDGNAGNGYGLSYAEASGSDISVSAATLSGGGLPTENPEPNVKQVMDFVAHGSVVSGQDFDDFNALFDKIEVFRTLDVGITGTQGAIFYLEQTVDMPANSTAFDALQVILGTKLDEALPFLEQYNPKTDIITSPPASGSIGRYQGLTFMGQALSVNGGVDTLFSSFENSSPEYFSTYNKHEGNPDGGRPLRFLRAGDAMFILAPSVLTHVFKAGNSQNGAINPLQFTGIHDKQGLLGKGAAHTIGNSVMLITGLGLGILSAADGNISQISSVDRVLKDDWASDLATVESAYDSLMGISYFLHPGDSEMLSISMTTQSSCKIEGANFVSASTGADIATGTHKRAHFVTKRGLIVVPDIYSTGSGTMNDISSSYTLNGTATGGSTTTIVDTAATFNAAQIGALVYATTGDNVGLAREITGVAGTTLTVAAFPNAITVGDTYAVSPVPFKVRFWPLRSTDEFTHLHEMFDRWVLTGVGVKCRKLSGYGSNVNNAWRAGVFRNSGSSIESTTVAIDVDSNPAASWGRLNIDGIDVEIYLEQISSGTTFELTNAQASVTMGDSKKVSS